MKTYEERAAYQKGYSEAREDIQYRQWALEMAARHIEAGGSLQETAEKFLAFILSASLTPTQSQSANEQSAQA